MIRLTNLLTQSDSYNSIRIERPLAWPSVAQELWSNNVHVETMKVGDLSLQGLEATDCLILHGVPNPGMMNLLRKLPCAFALFQDDLMTDMPEWNPNQISEAHKRCLAWSLENACAIVATTKPLADALGYPEKTRVLPNFGDFKDRSPRRSADCMKMAIAIHGNSHAGDIELLNDLNWSGRTVFWGETMPSSCIAMFRNKLGRMEMKPSRPDVGWIPSNNDHETYCAWKRNLAKSFGIGLAPICQHPFNLTKSCWKWIEYAEMGLVPVLSDIGPYTEIPDRAAVKVPMDGDWTQAVEHASQCPEIAWQAWEYGRDAWSMQRRWTEIVATYQFVASRI